MGVEDRLQERDGTDQDQQADRKAHRILHVAVREHADRENGGALGADGIGPEKLTQRERDEGHRFRGLHIHAAPVMLQDIGDRVPRRHVCARFEMPGQAQDKGGQHGGRLGDGLDAKAPHHAAVDDGFRLGARLVAA